MKPSHPTHGGKYGVVEHIETCQKDGYQKVRVQYDVVVGERATALSRLQYSRNFTRGKRVVLKTDKKRRNEKDRSVTHPAKGGKVQYAVIGDTATTTTITTHHRFGDIVDSVSTAPFIQMHDNVYTAFELYGFATGLRKSEGPSEKSKKTYNHQMNKEGIERFAVMMGNSNPLDITRKQVDDYYNITLGEGVMNKEDTHRLNSTTLKYWVRFCDKNKTLIKMVSGSTIE